MATRTPMDEVRAWITPALSSVLSIICISMVHEIRNDVKQLLETRATHNEQIKTMNIRLERMESKVFGISSASLLLLLGGLSCEKPKKLMMVIDNEIHFI